MLSRDDLKLTRAEQVGEVSGESRRKRRLEARGFPRPSIYQFSGVLGMKNDVSTRTVEHRMKFVEFIRSALASAGEDR